METSNEILSVVITDAIRAHTDAVGVLIRDVPTPDSVKLLEGLKNLIEKEKIDLRICYVRSGGKEAEKKVKINSKFFSVVVEQAERWRNDPNLKALIVVIAHGDEAKLSSLEDFRIISSYELKTILVEKALGDEQGGQNDVQVKWWKYLEYDDAVGLGQLIDYWLSLKGKKGQSFLEASSREIHLLGLLPDPQLFDDPRESSILGRIALNRDLISKLQTLTPKDRRLMVIAVENEKDTKNKKKLQEALDQLDRLRWEGEGLQSISFQSAERLIKGRKAKKKSKDDTTKSQTEKVIDIAAESLTKKSRVSDIKSIVEDLQTQLNNLDQSKLQPQALKISTPEISTDAITIAQLDILNLISKMLDDNKYGGVLEIDASNLKMALRRFDVQQHLISYWDFKRIEEFFDDLSEDDTGSLFTQQLKEYNEVRKHILPLARSLTVEPLAVAANPKSRNAILKFINSYEILCKTIRDGYEQLFNKFGSDFNDILSHLILLETIFIKTKDRIYALISPTHPLFLWHYGRYCQIINEQRELFDEKDKILITQAAKNLPNFLMALFVPQIVFDKNYMSVDSAF